MNPLSPPPSNRIASLILFAAIITAPFPFGSTEPATIAVWCIILGIGVVAASPRALRRGHLVVLAGAGIVIAGYAVVLHEQFSPAPWFAAPHPLWRAAADVLGAPLEPRAAIAQHQPYFAIGAPLAAMLAMILSLVLCVDRARARQLLQVMAWSGAAYAAFGIAMQFIDPTHVLWRDKLVDQAALVSTFINRNTAATYFGSCSIVWLLLLCERIRRSATGSDAPPRIDWSAAPRDAIPAALMLALCLAALLMTRSRAGVVLSLPALLIAFAGYAYRYLPPRRLLAAIAGSGVLALTALVVIGGDTMARFDEAGVEGVLDRGRWEVYASTLRMIAAHPWFGTGLGTFALSFPAYRGDSMWGIWDRAHSTPLELAAELGLPLTSLIVLAWVAVLAILLRGIMVRRRDHIVPTAAFAVAFLALSHSLMDFPLQIPGYAIVAFALTGAGLSQSFRTRT